MPPVAPPPPRVPPEPPSEWRDALLTYAPAVLVAFVLEWVLTTRSGWEPRRALIASVLFGIVVALLLQRSLARRRDR